MLNEITSDDTQIKEKIGASLKRFRQTFKQSQTDVAESLGILQQTYYKNESGRAAPSSLIIFKLANEYNISADYLLGLSDEPRPLNSETSKIESQEAKPVDNTVEEIESLKSENKRIKEQIAVLQTAVAKLAS